MKYAFILLIAIIFTISVYPQNYKRVKIYLNDSKEITLLREAGLEFDHFVWGKDKSIDCFISDDEFIKLKSTSFRYDVLIDDWFSYYKNLPKLSESDKSAVINKSTEIYNVTGLDFGSMGGYYTLDEVYDRLDLMYSSYPNIITQKFPIGTTIEGRPIYAVKISDNPNIEENEPQVFYNALTHAREPAGMMSVMYYMFYLLENYGTDPEVSFLVDNREIYFVPVTNPDGYEYNHITDPDGGGMWRKNKQDNNNNGIFETSQDGVDLNRNYGYEWGYDDIGSSPDPDDALYRGTAPFSEPETQTVRDFCNSKNFKTALNYHTYSNLLLYSWGYINDPTPDDNIFAEYGADMTQYNNYTFGQSPLVLYEVNGSADDWMYGEQTAKQKIFAMTPEVGGSSDGFWPAQSRIFPLAEENLYPNLYYTWVAGAYVGLIERGYSKEYFNPGDTISMNSVFRNKGLSDGENYEVQLTSLSPYIVINNGIALFGSIPARESVSLPTPFSFAVSSSAPTGIEARLLLTVKFDNIIMSSDTLKFIIGTPTFFFKDTTNNPSELWTINRSPGNSPQWEATASSFYSGPVSYTDSKDGNYINDATVTMTLTGPIDISEIKNPRLSFQTKYNIEGDWDYGQVEISTDNGVTWMPLEGQYTNPGSGSFQPFGEPVYDGLQSTWVREDISLVEYSTSQIKIRFVITTDEAVTMDGWYLDDIGIIYYDTTLTSLNEDQTQIVNEYSLEQNYPNPFNPSTKISWQSPVSGWQTLKVYDVLGNLVETLLSDYRKAGKHSIEFDAGGLSSGIYFYTLTSENFSQTKKMILLR